MTMIRQAPADTSDCAEGPGASHGLRAIDQDLHGAKERYLDDPRRTAKDPRRLRSSVCTRKIQRRAGKGCRIHLKETHRIIACRRPCRLKTVQKLTQKNASPEGYRLALEDGLKDAALIRLFCLLRKTSSLHPQRKRRRYGRRASAASGRNLHNRAGCNARLRRWTHRPRRVPR